MKKLQLLLLFFVTFISTYSQTTIFSANFNSDNGGFNILTGVGGNNWVINNKYAGGFFGFIANTPTQPVGIVGSPTSNYLHITNDSVCGIFDICNANYDTSSNSDVQISTLAPISTTGFTGVSISFWYLCDGFAGDAFGTVEYRIGSGAWTQVGGQLQGITTWTQTTFTNPAFDNVPVLRFRFRWQNGNEIGSDPAFSVDDIFVKGTSAATCALTGALPAGNYAIPSVCFPTVASAATYINTNGTTGTGNVQFDVAAGHTEIAPAGGIAILATSGGTALKPIIFKKSGAGVNPTITSFNALSTGSLTDGIIKIIGADYVTIDGFTLLENAANSTTTIGTNNMTEYGVALFYTSTSDGAQNNTIQNCTIDLNKTYTNTFGIYSNSNVTATNAGTSSQSAGLAGSNSNLTIIRNTITDVNEGIAIVGSGAASTAHNDGLVIGGTLADANSITNFGTASVTSGFSGVSQTIYGILVRNTKNFNISYNTITCSTAPNISTVRGVFIDSFVQAPTGTLIHTISNNIISLSNGAAGAGIDGIFNSTTTGNATTTININNNDFNNFTANTITTFIKNYQSGIAININNNTFTNLAINNTGFANYFIDMGLTASTATGTQNVNFNKIIGTFTKNGASGGLGIYLGTGSSLAGAVVNNNNNEFSNITLAGTTLIEGWRNADGATSGGPTKSINLNKFENWSGGTGLKTVISTTNCFGTSSVSNNTISNINSIISATGAIIGINCTSAGATATQFDIKNNSISAISGGATASGTSITGIKYDSKSTNINIENNTLNNFLCAGPINGIESINATPTLITISGNTVDGLKSSVATLNINGILNSANTLPKIENNSIKNLENTNAASTGYVRGINITNAFATTLPPIINNNVIDGLISASTTNSSSIAGIVVSASANHNITSNTIKNITCSTTNTNTNSSTPVVGILTSSSGTAQLINNNIVFNIFSNNTTAAVNVAGILTSASSSAGSQVNANRIYGLKNESGAVGATISGIYIAGGGVWTFSNNMISLNNGGSTSSATCIGINDIGNNGARKYFFNSINIFGAGTSGSASVAFQFKRFALMGTAEIKNNIFNNIRTSGNDYAVANTGTYTTSATAVYDYNILNAADANKIGLIDTVNHTFASWQTTTAGDANSLTAINIPFTDTATADLHILNSGCGFAYNGIPVSTTTDYDAQTRSATLPTIGADESTGTRTKWNGSTWSNGAPTTTSTVEISGNYDMTLGATRPSIDACNLTINNNAVVTIDATKYLNIKTDLTTAAGTTLNVLDKASLVMVDDSGLVTNNGTTNVTKTTTPYERYDYTFWSSPVKNINIGNVFSAWRLDYAFNYQTQNFQDLYGGLGFPQTTGVPDTFDDNNNDWFAVNASTPIIAATGYAIMAPTAVSFATSPTATVVFSGEVNNGIKTVVLKQSQNTIDTTDDFNLVGNPYPSSIKADDFIKANILPLATANNISGTLYFWSHKDDIQPFTTNAGPNIFNFNSNDYANYNLTGATGTGAASGSGSALPNGFIASGQGFFVEAETTNNLVFNNSMRNKTYTNNQFFRQANNTNTSNSSTEKDRFWLNLTNTDNMFSQQLIGYLPESTLDFDYGYDGQGASTTNFVNFYSIMNNDFSKQFKIQSRSALNINDAVPLGYSSAVSGTTTISIDHLEGVFSNQNIYLQDNLLNIIHDLKQSPYTFTTTFGTFNDRFVLKYLNSNLAVSTVVNEENSVKIAVNSQVVHLLSEKEKIKTIQVFDVLGRNIYENNQVNNKSFAIDNLLIKNQALIVKINLENGAIIIRKIVL